MPEISIMAAMDTHRAIGYQGQLPWQLPADLARVKQLAKGQTFIMGRQTFQSADAIISPSKNIVLSNTICELHHPNSFRVASMQEALDLLEPNEQVLIMGGVQVYKEALTFAQKMFLTFVHHQFKADAFFPAWKEEEWKIVHETRFPADSENPYPYSFVDFERV